MSWKTVHSSAVLVVVSSIEVMATLFPENVNVTFYVYVINFHLTKKRTKVLNTVCWLLHQFLILSWGDGPSYHFRRWGSLLIVVVTILLTLIISITLGQMLAVNMAHLWIRAVTDHRHHYQLLPPQPSSVGLATTNVVCWSTSLPALRHCSILYPDSLPASLPLTNVPSIMLRVNSTYYYYHPSLHWGGKYF